MWYLILNFTIITIPVIWDWVITSQLIRVAQPVQGGQVRSIPSFVLMKTDSWWRRRRGVEGRRGWGRRQRWGGEWWCRGPTPLCWGSFSLLVFLIRVVEKGPHVVSHGRGRPPEKGLHVFQAKLWACHHRGHSGCCWSQMDCVMMKEEL